MLRGKISFLLVISLLVTIFLSTAVLAETSEDTWIKVAPRSEEVSISVKPDGTGEFVATVKAIFGSSGYRVNYKDEVGIAAGILPDNTKRISFVGEADIEVWTGASLTVMTEETMTYHLGKLGKGTYSFTFKTYDFSKTCEFEVSEGFVDWVLKDDEVSISAEPNKNGEYIANVKLTLPHAGFRVSYEDIARIPEMDLPNGSEESPFLGAALVEEWTGPADQVITEEVLNYNLGKLKPGIYYFMFLAKDYKQLYKFEVVPPEEYISYGDINDDGNINSTDLTLIRRCILQKKYDVRADLNIDGFVNSTDITIFKRYMFKLIATLPFYNGGGYVVD